MTEPKEKQAEESDEGSDGAQGSSNRKPKTTIGTHTGYRPENLTDPWNQLATDVG